MKKMIIVLTSIAAVILMVSSATAVPNANSELLVNEINEKTNIMEKLEEFYDEIQTIDSKNRDILVSFSSMDSSFSEIKVSCFLIIDLLIEFLIWVILAIIIIISLIIRIMIALCITVMLGPIGNILQLIGSFFGVLAEFFNFEGMADRADKIYSLGWEISDFVERVWDWALEN